MRICLVKHVEMPYFRDIISVQWALYMYVCGQFICFVFEEVFSKAAMVTYA
jgi:hypothetical protein